MVSATAPIAAGRRVDNTTASDSLAYAGTLDGVGSAIRSAMARPARSGTLNGLMEATREAYNRAPAPGTLNSLTAALASKNRLDMRA